MRPGKPPSLTTVAKFDFVEVWMDAPDESRGVALVEKGEIVADGVVDGRAVPTLGGCPCGDHEYAENNEGSSEMSRHGVVLRSSASATRAAQADAGTSSSAS